MLLLDLIFPSRCIGCDAYLQRNESRREGPVCALCRGGIFPLHGPGCPRCGAARAGFIGEEASGVDDLCVECIADPPPYLTARAFWEYDGIIAEVIQRIKYGHDLGRLGALGNLMREELIAHLQALARSLPGEESTVLLIPVPMHRRDLRKRGFDLPALLGRRCLTKTAFSIREDILCKIRHTSPQASLSRIERRTNLEGAFMARSPARSQAQLSGGPDPVVVLFDDVMTTGATAREAARALSEAGWPEIHVLALARTL